MYVHANLRPEYNFRTTWRQVLQGPLNIACAKHQLITLFIFFR